ncbi:uncharacterized protein LOC132194323 [Neocloeon triangulifer]|uniref:uncharacterized protein LOC132194323 n=1 Tax=Neocloeon triangulifer TaxID=2078957 RepID=UPI00286EC689|nr:uncharacterized protein LOC132194323 [Neocloeon triangulifer]
MAHSVLLVLFLAATAHQGLAIKCYQCTSKSNPECANPSMMGELKASECTPSMQWSAKSLNDVLPQGVNKFLDSVTSSIGSIAQNIPVEMVCMKTNIKSGDETVIMRHCAAAITSNDGTPKGSGVCEQVKKAADGKAEYCGVCDTDGCNSAPSIRSFGFVLLAPLIALFYKLA